MKNINIDENNIDLEKLLETETLPISINNQYVILDYDEYIDMLREVAPYKVQEIEEAIMYETEFKVYIKYFTKEIIEELKEQLLIVFHDSLKKENLREEYPVNCIISTMGYNTALHNVFDTKENGKEFFEWYDALEWYDSDNFDGLIQDLILESEQ